MYRLIILDFDGVILESVAAKTGAVRMLFSSEPGHVEEITDFYIRNPGMSRPDKFRYIYSHILKREPGRETFNRLSDQLAGIIYDVVIGVPFVPGAPEFLARWSTKFPLYIVSSTPEHELRDIVEARDLTTFFRGVYGAPRKKADCIRDILARTGTPGSVALFVGDAISDLAAAREAGVHFAGRVKAGDPDVFRDAPGIDTIVPDLFGLSRYLEATA